MVSWLPIQQSPESGYEKARQKRAEMEHVMQSERGQSRLQSRYRSHLHQPDGHFRCTRWTPDRCENVSLNGTRRAATEDVLLGSALWDETINESIMKM